MIPTIVSKIINNDGSSIDIDNTSNHTGMAIVILNGSDLTIGGSEGDYSKIIRGETTPTSSILIGNTITEVLTFTAVEDGNYRFFLNGIVNRVGGGNGVGILHLELIDSTDTILIEDDFEVFRDLNTSKQLFTAKSFNLNVLDVLRIRASYTPATTETISLSNVIVGFDCIIN